MNITINPISHTKSVQTFKGYSGDCGYDDDDDDYKVGYSTYKDDLKRAEAKGFNEGIISGALGVTLLSVAIGAADSNQTNKSTDKFIDDINNIATSKDIKRDSFSVKDMTDDNQPDLILYKKDGSAVVVD